MAHERIERELSMLEEGGQKATLVSGTRSGAHIECITYSAVPTAGAACGLPATTDVLVPVPGGYPANAIDLAGLPLGSLFLGRVVGQTNVHGTVETAGRQWCLVSYHPHNGGGAPPWNPMQHGFHTYLDELLTWLAKLS